MKINNTIYKEAREKIKLENYINCCLQVDICPACGKSLKPKPCKCKY